MEKRYGASGPGAIAYFYAHGLDSIGSLAIAKAIQGSSVDQSQVDRGLSLLNLARMEVHKVSNTELLTAARTLSADIDRHINQGLELKEI